MRAQYNGAKIVMFSLCPVHGSNKRSAQDGRLYFFSRSARFNHSMVLLTMQGMGCGGVARLGQIRR